MPQAIINIELDEKCGPGLSVASRQEAVLLKLRKFFTRSIGEVASVEYEGPDGVVQESTAVISFEYQCDKNIVLSAASQLSAQFNQDCVAVLFGDGEGRLVGPEADRWGGFKLEFFKRPAMFNIFQKAA